MIQIIESETARLKLRQWRDNDYTDFSELNADPAVMEHFPSTLSKTKSDEIANKIQSLITRRGWGFWAVEEKKTNSFIGFVGLHQPIKELPFSPCVEVGWRLAKQFWGKGYATEAAEAALKIAFERLELDKIYSFTSVGNLRSRAVMERLHMINTNQNFEHPEIPAGNPLREHVLYSLTKDQWKQSLETV